MKTLVQHINERLVINKNTKMSFGVDAVLEDYIFKHLNDGDIDEDHFNDVDDLVNLITYNFWKPDYNLRTPYKEARTYMFNELKKYEVKFADDAVVYSANDMHIKELDELFNDKGKKLGYMPSSGKTFSITYLALDNYMIIRYDNSKLSYGKICDAVVQF